MPIDTLASEIKTPISQATGKLADWLDTFIDMIPNRAVSVILLVIFVLLGKIAQKLFDKIFKRYSKDEALKLLFGKSINYSVVGIGLFVILEILNLQKAVTSLLAGVGIIGLALGFAFQDIAANFVSGIILALKKPFRIGDVVEIQSFMGTVTKTTLRITCIETWQGQEVYLPNKDVLNSPIINYSVLGQRRIDLTVGISYGEDL